MRPLPVPLFVLLAVVTCALPACGQPQKDQDPPKKAAAQEKDKAKLSVGDPAPPWKVTTWLNGNEVKPEKGKVYVIEFWATWCVPCIKAMPHLAELQADHKAEGLVVIGMTHGDDNGNTREEVTKFVAERGPKLGYVFAFCDTSETYAAYMDAANQRGIPCSYVIDKEGKIAYIGHPDMLDAVLPKVLAGKWQGKADAAAIDELSQLLSSDTRDPAAVLAGVDEFAKKNPEMANTPMMRGVRFSLLLGTQKFDDAKAVAEELFAEADKKKRLGPAAYVMGFADPSVNPDKKHLDLAVKAADLVVKLGSTDVGQLLGATVVYMTAGQKDKATSSGKKAIAAAPNDKAKAQVGKEIDRILAGGK